MPKPTEQKPKQEMKGGKIAVVRVRGQANLDTGVLFALKSLRLLKPHVCVIIPNTPSMFGLVKKAKDYVTWGEVDDATARMLEEKRGEKHPDDPKKLKPFFRLSPPVKGFGKNGIKIPFVKGGALGYRGAKINDLIKRMI